LKIPCNPSSMNPSLFVDMDFDGIVIIEEFEKSTGEAVPHEIFRNSLDEILTSFVSQNFEHQRVLYLGHWILMLKFNEEMARAGSVQEEVRKVITKPNNKIERIYIKCGHIQIWNGLMNEFKTQLANLSTLRHLYIELGNGNTMAVLKDLMTLKLKLTTLKLKVRDSIDPYFILNFLLQQHETLEILILRLPKSFDSAMATDLHSVYPFSKVLTQYSLYRGKKLIFECSDVKNCNRVNHGKSWPGTKKEVDIFAKANKNKT